MTAAKAKPKTLADLDLAELREELDRYEREIVRADNQARASWNSRERVHAMIDDLAGRPAEPDLGELQHEILSRHTDLAAIRFGTAVSAAAAVAGHDAVVAGLRKWADALSIGRNWQEASVWTVGFETEAERVEYIRDREAYRDGFKQAAAELRQLIERRRQELIDAENAERAEQFRDQARREQQRTAQEGERWVEAQQAARRQRRSQP